MLSVVVQLGMLNFLRAQKTNLAEQVAQSSSPGDTSGARQRGLRQDRPASDEEVPSTSGFPGSSKADLPMTWQLRGVSIHNLEAVSFRGLGRETVHGRQSSAQKL